jgi:hypothetical protein
MHCALCACIYGLKKFGDRRSKYKYIPALQLKTQPRAQSPEPGYPIFYTCCLLYLRPVPPRLHGNRCLCAAAIFALGRRGAVRPPTAIYRLYLEAHFTCNWGLSFCPLDRAVGRQICYL